MIRPLALFAVLAAFALPAVAEPVLGKNEQPIHDAARLGSRTDIERILRADPAARDAITALGSTPLHFAALNLDSGPLKALLAAGAKVNARDAEGATPLHLAAYATRTENVRLLLEAGADLSLKTNAGRDALSIARKVRADEAAGIMAIWLLKGCKPSVPC